MAGKPSRRARAATKVTKPAAPKAKPVQTPVHPVTLSASLPSVIGLSRQAIKILWQHKKLFGGIVAIYGLLSVVFVTGLSAGIDVAAIRNEFGSRIIGSLAAYTELVGGSAAGSTQSASVYQSVFFIMVSLALIWALRQAYAGNRVRIRDAYYESMYPLVPCLLVLLVIIVQLVPMIIGSSIYQLVVSNGIAVTTIEVLLWGSLVLALSILSLYFISASLMAFYIATLPGMTPLRALKLARKLVSGRRWSVLRKLLFLPLVLLILTAALLLPLILIVPVVAQWAVLLVGPILIAFGHSYVYALYRGLMNE